MNKEEFTDTIINFVKGYIANANAFDSNPQLRINPRSLTVGIINGSDMLAEIENSNEAIEDAAGVDGDMSEDAADYQVKQNPDFYPIKDLTIVAPSGITSPRMETIDALISKYY